MKIVLVIPTLTSGGSERVISELANIWASQGHSVSLILLWDKNKVYEINSNVKIIELGFVNSKNLVMSIYLQLKLFLNLRGALKRESPNFVLSFMLKYNILTLLSAKGLGLRVFVSDRNNPLNKISSLMMALKKITYPYAQGIIAQTDIAREIIYEETKNNNITVIPNPLKMIRIDESIKREKILLNIGRLTPQKGQKYLLDIFKRSKAMKDWRLVILGNGEDEMLLKQHAHKLGISERVEFKGSVSNVDFWYSRASIFAFTSLYEGFPNALLEAMSSGISCVSYNCNTGPSELIKDGVNGFLVPVKNIDIFVNRLDQLGNDKLLRERLGGEAAKVKRIYNKESVAKKFLDFCLNK